MTTPIIRLLPGLLIASAVAAGAMHAADQPLFKNTLRLSPLLLVILLGMGIRSLVPLPAYFESGLRTAQRPVLRWAVAGLGFKLSILELIRIGAPALLVVVVCTFASLMFGWWLARAMGIGGKLGLLLGVGGSVCGASAVVAADTVVQGEKGDAACALGIITLLGTIGIVVYPALARLMGLDEQVFAVWNGASLHEMAHVVAAGYGVSEEAARTATVVKLARISLLAPIVVTLGWVLRRGGSKTGTAVVAPVPWFLVVFVACAAINSIPSLQASAAAKEFIRRIQTVDLWLLCVGMAGVGLQSGFSDLRASGFRPILVGAGQWVFLGAMSLGMAALICAR